jgi:hypothetical protein
MYVRGLRESSRNSCSMIGRMTIGYKSSLSASHPKRTGCPRSYAEGLNNSIVLIR